MNTIKKSIITTIFLLFSLNNLYANNNQERLACQEDLRMKIVDDAIFSQNSAGFVYDNLFYPVGSIIKHSILLSNGWTAKCHYIVDRFEVIDGYLYVFFRNDKEENAYITKPLRSIGNQDLSTYSNNRPTIAARSKKKVDSSGTKRTVTIEHTRDISSALGKDGIVDGDRVCRHFFARNQTWDPKDCSKVSFGGRELKEGDNIRFEAATEYGILDCTLRGFKVIQSSPTQCSIGGVFRSE